MQFNLVRNEVSHDTVSALEALLVEAREGRLIGLIFGAMLQRRRFMVSCVGDARSDPSFSRGMCCALDDKLGAIVQQHAGPATII